MPEFQPFSGFVHYFAFAKLATTSIRIGNSCYVGHSLLQGKLFYYGIENIFLTQIPGTRKGKFLFISSIIPLLSFFFHVVSVTIYHVNILLLFYLNQFKSINLNS